MFRFLALFALFLCAAAHAEVVSVASYPNVPQPANAFAAASLPLIERPLAEIAESRLTLPAPAAVAAREANQIGFAVSLTSEQAALPALLLESSWTVVGSRKLARLTLLGEAAALRAGLRRSADFPGRVFVLGASNQPESEVQFPAGELAWSDLSAGSELSLLIDIPADYRFRAGDLSLPLLSVFDKHPLRWSGNAFANIYPDTASCAIDLVCAISSLHKSAGAAVMLLIYTKAGASYVCSGTLLGDKAKSYKPYVYTAHHCIDSQAVASTVVTIWNNQYPGCYSNNSGMPSGYTKLSKGAQLLNSEQDNDHALLLLNDTPPTNAFFMGWTTALLQAGDAVVSINHPNGDVKKLSGGNVKSPSSGAADTGVYHTSVWRVDITQGASQHGSSGGGLLTCDSQSCYLRGGVLGGVDSEICSGHSSTAFSRFDMAYPKLKNWLGDVTPVVAPPVVVAPSLSSLNFTGWPTSINANSSAAIGTLTAIYSNDTRKTVTATITSSNSALLDIKNGQLIAASASVATPVLLTASFSESGKTISANLTVTITTSTVATPTPTPTLISSDDCLFNWAEKNYPELFSPAAGSKTLANYTYRYYSASNSYLATISNDSNFYYLGPFSGNSLINLGLRSAWLTKAKCL